MPSVRYAVKLTRHRDEGKVNVSRPFPVPPFVKSYRKTIMGDVEVLRVYPDEKAANLGHGHELYAQAVETYSAEKRHKMVLDDMREIRMRIMSLRRANHLPMHKVEVEANPRYVARIHLMAMAIRRHIMELQRELDSFLPGPGVGVPNKRYQKQKPNSD